MHLSSSAWNAVDMTTIQNCWDKARILPDFTCLPTTTSPISVLVSMLINTPTHICDPIAQAEEAVKSTLNKLESLGVLQKAN